MFLVFFSISEVFGESLHCFGTMPFPMIVISLFEIHMVLNSFRQFTRGGKQYS